MFCFSSTGFTIPFLAELEVAHVLARRFVRWPLGRGKPAVTPVQLAPRHSTRSGPAPCGREPSTRTLDTSSFCSHRVTTLSLRSAPSGCGPCALC